MAMDDNEQQLYAEITACKNESFWEEREWRLTISPLADDKRIFYKPGRFGITPRFPIEILAPNVALPIERIVVSPCPHPDEAVSAVKMLLRHRGIQLRSHGSPNGVEVVPSKIPYRNW